jgi:ElaB/YqjD/DUF883 family membrane-anchored ribosome-binding protein
MNEKPGKSAVGTEKERATADRLAGQATDAISSAKTAIQNTVGNVADRATAATQWASATVNAATQAPNDVVEAGAEYIRARPYVAVGAALAVGYLIGKLR